MIDVCVGLVSPYDGEVRVTTVCIERLESLFQVPLFAYPYSAEALMSKCYFHFWSHRGSFVSSLNSVRFLT